jgi:hypothetical protein
MCFCYQHFAPNGALGRVMKRWNVVKLEGLKCRKEKVLECGKVEGYDICFLRDLFLEAYL